VPADEEKVYEQAAAIPFRIRNGVTEILIVTNQSGKRWILPKGLQEPGLTPHGSAEMEAFEEAGVKGRVYPSPAGEYTYTKWDGTCRVQVFLLDVTAVVDDWPESGLRERRWVGLDEALAVLDPRIPREIMAKVPELIRAGRQAPPA
jgi:8-oxo-dGTP pyrophosphatase MutT (NUDIX family)